MTVEPLPWRLYILGMGEWLKNIRVVAAAAFFIVAMIGCSAEQKQKWADFDPLDFDRSAATEGADEELLTRVTDNPTDDDGDPTWLPHPVDVRVYPTTRFAMADGQVVLETRIELVDAMGDPVKAPGLFGIALEGAQRGDMSPFDQTMYRWQMRVRTLNDQRRHYDPVTQTYLFNLKLRELAAPRQAVTVKATFTTMQGKVLEGEFVIAE